MRVFHSTRTATNRHELIDFRIRGISWNFMSIRDVLRFCYDRVTNVRQIRLGLYEYGKIQLRYTKVYWRIRHESVKDTPKASTNQIRIKGNSWQFLTIRKIFSHLALFGHYFQNKCSSESCCCIGSTFGVSIPTVYSTKQTASKKLRRGDPDFLTLWLEKVAS